MIEESLQEEACLFVLGLLSESDSHAFQVEMARNSELRSFVAGANNATLALARSAPRQELSPDVKQRLLSTLRLPAHTSQVVSFPKRSGWSVVPWSIAACLLGILTWQHFDHQTEKSILQADVRNRRTCERGSLQGGSPRKSPAQFQAGPNRENGRQVCCDRGKRRWSGFTDDEHHGGHQRWVT